MLNDCSSELHESYGNGQFLDERLPLRKQTRQLVAKFLGIDESKAAPRAGLGLFRFVRV